MIQTAYSNKVKSAATQADLVLSLFIESLTKFQVIILPKEVISQYRHAKLGPIYCRFNVFNHNQPP